MSKQMTDLTRLWRFNDGVTRNVIKGFDDADWTRTVGECQPAAWIMGHLATSRRSFGRMIDADLPEADWEAAFDRGSSASDGDLPMSASELVTEFLAAGDALFARIDQLTEDEASKAAGPMPDGSTTVAGVLGFGYFHETYHVGQLGLLRRIAGKEGFA